MKSVVVVDASALLALLVDGGPLGDWVAGELHGHRVAAPQLVHYEATNIIRRQVAADQISDEVATLARADLADLAIRCWPFAAFGERAWELRHNLTTYDASYVALAELLGASFVTLDERVSRASGVRCPVLTPSAG